MGVSQMLNKRSEPSGPGRWIFDGAAALAEIPERYAERAFSSTVTAWYAAAFNTGLLVGVELLNRQSEPYCCAELCNTMETEGEVK